MRTFKVTITLEVCFLGPDDEATELAALDHIDTHFAAAAKSCKYPGLEYVDMTEIDY